jgi:Ca2+-binding RTX toxin-like protein
VSEESDGDTPPSRSDEWDAVPVRRREYSKMTIETTKMMGKQSLILFAALIALLVFSGMALAATVSCQVNVECFGTKNADTLEGTALRDYEYGRGGADTLRGLGEDDSLYGQGGSDMLFAGPGGDNLVGGAGNDAMNGGGGIDWYYFEDGWGEDSITDDAVSGTKIAFVNPDTGVLAANSLIVDLKPGTGPEAKDESGTNTLNWEGNVIDTIAGGDGDDRFAGNASANVFFAGPGADTIHGGGGRDQVYVHDGSTADTVHCGPGEDTVYYDADSFGVVSDDIASDCEHLHAQ